MLDSQIFSGDTGVVSRVKRMVLHVHLTEKSFSTKQNCTQVRQHLHVYRFRTFTPVTWYLYYLNLGRGVRGAAGGYERRLQSCGWKKLK